MNPGTQVCFAPPKTVEWSTPQDFYDKLDAEFGFTLDVAATDDNAKCARYFTVATGTGSTRSSSNFPRTTTSSER